MLNLEDARELARVIAESMFPNAIEVEHEHDGMSPYKVADVVDEDPDVCGVVILYDKLREEYAIVDEPTCLVPPGTDIEQLREQLINEVELKIFMLFGLARDVSEAGGTWGAIESTTAQSARARIKELHGDVDEVIRLLDDYNLTDPDLHC